MRNVWNISKMGNRRLAVCFLSNKKQPHKCSCILQIQVKTVGRQLSLFLVTLILGLLTCLLVRKKAIVFTGLRNCHSQIVAKKPIFRRYLEQLATEWFVKLELQKVLEFTCLLWNAKSSIIEVNQLAMHYYAPRKELILNSCHHVLLPWKK